MYCPKCGKELKDNAHFCKYCGAKISNAVNPHNFHDEITQKTKKENDEKKKKMIIIALVIVIIIAAISCFVIVSGALNDDNQENTVKPTITTTTANAPATSAVSNSFKVSDAPALANVVKSSGYASSVNFGGITYSKAQYLYILTKSITEIAKGNTQGSFAVNSYSYCSSPSGKDLPQTITLSQYVDMCTRFSKWMDSKGSVPNYSGISQQGSPDISPSNMAKICCNILIHYGNSGSLPQRINI